MILFDGSAARIETSASDITPNYFYYQVNTPEPISIYLRSESLGSFYMAAKLDSAKEFVDHHQGN